MRYRYQSGEQVYDIVLEKQGDHYQASINGEPYEFELLDIQPGEVNLMANGCPTSLFWASNGEQKWVSLDGCTYLLEKPATQRARRSGEHAAEDMLRAPMPAQVRAVQVSEGDKVEKGQTILILEAMKMEIRVQAARAGQVARLLVTEGQQVERNQILAEIR